jgi:Flp pilus assembly protein CpaB
MTRPPAADATVRNRLPVSRRDRRPALAALALLLVVAGALGAALVAYRSGHRTDVLVAAHEIKTGQRVSSSDFTVARVAADSDLVVPAGDRKAFVGSYATTDIPAGSLINHLMFRVGTVLPPDGMVVGVTLSVEQRPAATITTNDVVRAFLVPKGGQSSDTTPVGQVLVDAARVVNVSSNSSETVTASLLVTADDAQKLIAPAAQGSVALAVLPAATKPAIDYRTGS